MLMYNIAQLSRKTEAALSKQQAKVDAVLDRKQKYDLATELFRRKTPKHAFDEIKRALDERSPPVKSCYYCERDRYRDIDHIWPKRHYPEKSFNSINYAYACTICNQDAKNDRFAVFDSQNNIIEFDRSLSYSQVVPIGPHVIIDIRNEDPLDFLQLDLTTGLHVPIGNSDVEKKRGTYTRDLFKLDSDTLSKYRRSAFQAYKNYLEMYNEEALKGDSRQCQLILSEILDLPFPTVLVEMRRQSQSITGLSQLFAYVPASLGAR